MRKEKKKVVISKILERTTFSCYCILRGKTRLKCNKIFGKRIFIFFCNFKEKNYIAEPVLLMLIMIILVKKIYIRKKYL